MQAIAMCFTDHCSDSISKVKDSITELHSAHKRQAPTVAQLQSMANGGRRLQVTAVTSLGEQDETFIQQSDILSAMSFSQTGKHLAVGDYGGRCIVFESVVDSATGTANYEYFLEFQSHHKAIDFYSNQEIPDMITQICWLKEPCPTSLLTSNSRTIKLWKLQQKFGRKTEGAKRICKKGLGLVIPKRKVADAEPEHMSKLCHTFKSNFAGNLHSLSPTTDSLNFLSADEKSINLWSLEHVDHAAIYSLVDFSKPQKEVAGGASLELISSACFNQFTKKEIFLYTTSLGSIKVCDLRERSNFQSRASSQMRADSHNSPSMYNQWLSYVSSASFLPDEYQLISRDYLSVKLWDTRMEKVIFSAPVMQQAERQLNKLYNASALDDEFFMSVSRDGRYVATGGYDKTGHIIDVAANFNIAVKCSHVSKRQATGVHSAYNSKKQLVSMSQSGSPTKVSAIDSQKQVTLGCWSPPDLNSSATLALGYKNCIYLYDTAPSSV